jgi:DNA invertase Pin-like site-specific DNA recombinase
LELQLDALHKADCETIFQEKASGATKVWPELDRLGRFLKHLLDMVAELEFQGVGLFSLIDAINKTPAQGRLVFNLFASLSEFERELIRERTHEGLASAQARGRVGGRRGLPEEAERTAIVAETLYREQQLGANEIVLRLHISKVTLYKYLRHWGVVIHSHRKATVAKSTM